MKKFLMLMVFICAGSWVFAQTLDASLGFQYGTARVVDDGVTVRKITEPGAVITVRMVPSEIGFFGRFGMLFPSKVTEGGATLTYDNYSHILFINGALGASFKVPITNQFSFFFDTGLSINDLLYGGSYKETIDASWKIKLENLGTTLSGGGVYRNVDMKESYNDFGIGIMGNAAMRFNFTQRVYLELGLAASFDFWRLRSYEFAADFTKLSDAERKSAADNVAGVEKDDQGRATKLVLKSSSKSNFFKQWTFIPSLSVGMSF